MSTSYSLAVDCGSDRAIADQLVKYYAQFEIVWDDLSRDPIPCESSLSLLTQPQCAKRQTDCWFVVSVHPAGLRLGTGIQELLRPDLLCIISDKICQPLLTFDGFRSAWFGQNAERNLCSLDWPRRLKEILAGEFHPPNGMIFANSLVQESTLLPEMIEFSDKLVVYRSLQHRPHIEHRQVIPLTDYSQPHF